ncbi:unnamed protein product [Ectocarpus sp. 12 AP-2014]
MKSNSITMPPPPLPPPCCCLRLRWVAAAAVLLAAALPAAAAAWVNRFSKDSVEDDTKPRLETKAFEAADESIADGAKASAYGKLPAPHRAVPSASIIMNGD